MSHTYGCFDDEDRTYLNPRCDCSEPCMDHPCEKGYVVPPYEDDNITRHLDDRLFATVLDSLQITRDLLRARGLTGNDCQAALDVLYQGVNPGTNGITYRLGQHERLMAGRIQHDDDTGE